MVRMGQIAAAMSLVGAALGEQADLSAGREPVLGLVVRGQDLELRHGVNTNGGQLVAVIPGVNVADAIEGQIVLVVSRTVSADSGQPGMPCDTIIIGVYNSWGETSQGEIAASVDPKVTYLVG